MSNLDAKKDWEIWHPEEIYLNDSKKNYDFFWNTIFFKEVDLFHAKQHESDNELKKIDVIKQKSCNNEKLNFLNIQKNLEIKEKKYILLNNKLQDLCVNFESTIALFEKTLFSRLLKTILIISSYVIGEKFLINEDILLKKIKKIIKSDNFFLKKPQLVIHPSNKKILEKILKKRLNKTWELVCNKSIDINSFKIYSEQSDIDATLYARWKEVYRLILEEAEEHQ